MGGGGGGGGGGGVGGVYGLIDHGYVNILITKKQQTHSNYLTIF